MISKFAGKTDLAKRKGDTVEILRLHTPDPVTQELIGVNEPIMSEFSYEKLQFKLKRYSSWFPLAGHIIKTHDDPYLEMAMATAKEQAARSAETLGAAIIKGGSSAFYSTGTSRAEVKDYLRAGLLDVQQRYLEINETTPITKMFDSTSNWGEEALDACFITIAPHELANDFRNLTGFVRVENYSSRVKPMMGEIGTYNRQRVICSGFFKALEGVGATLSSGEQLDIMSTGGKADVFQVVLLVLTLLTLVDSRVKKPLLCTFTMPRFLIPTKTVTKAMCLGNCGSAVSSNNKNTLAASSVLLKLILNLHHKER
jgi:N4-gp56 family major capsid protein